MGARGALVLAAKDPEIARAARGGRAGCPVGAAGTGPQRGDRISLGAERHQSLAGIGGRCGFSAGMPIVHRATVTLQLRTLSSDHPEDGPPFDQVAL
jgi:hypothetical protein